MGAAALVAAFLVSIAPAALALLPGDAWSLSGFPSLALALAPWLAVAGLPRGRGRPLPPVAIAGLMLPALALAAAHDVRSGLPGGALAEAAGWGLALALALAYAAQRGGAAHGALWLIAVPGMALLLHARAVVGVQAPSALGGVLAASPLVWSLECLELVREGAAGHAAAPFGPLAVAALLALVSRWRGLTRGEGA